jgi:hypothetical protein
MVAEYERIVKKEMKCTMEGLSTEFVSISMKHDLSAGTMELTQPKYWESAVERFKIYLADSGPKKRAIPMSVPDYTLMVGPSAESVGRGRNFMTYFWSWNSCSSSFDRAQRGEFLPE